MIRTLMFLISILFLNFSYGPIEKRKIVVDHEYVMGDNDSRNDARRICFLEAKRKILEKAGIYVESQTVVKNFQLTEDKIYAYTAALLKVEVLREEWKTIGLTMTLAMTVSAEVDIQDIENQMAKIVRDVSTQQNILEQLSRLQDLEQRYFELKDQISTMTNLQNALDLRKERNVVFKQIDELQSKKLEIVEKISSKTRDALQFIEKGMVKGEVISLIGQPRSKADFPYEEKAWNYGDVWVIFDSGIVQCIMYSRCFHFGPFCQSYRDSCVAK